MMRLNKGFAAASAGLLILGFTSAGKTQDASARVQTPPFDVAQFFGAPPADVGSPRSAPDEASLLIRVERLESQIRQMNGQLEQMQFENRRLEEQLQKFQQDVEFRFQEGGHAKPSQKHGELEPRAPSQTAVRATEEPGSQTTPPTAPPQPKGHGDAFDPTVDPNAPGAPRVLGGISPTNAPPPAPLPNSAMHSAQSPDGLPPAEARNPDEPLDLSSSPDKAPRPPASPPVPPAAGQLVPNPTAPLKTPGGTIIANAQPNAPPVNAVKEEFDLALGYLKQKDYDAAEKSFSSFLQKNPKSRYSAEAIYYLGESYYLRGRQREAAEQYLKISSDYANSARAPEALLRLGQSLHALGAKEQACASFSEVSRKYPNASAAVKAAAAREAKRVQC
ncbi:MAG: tol-pal system protein YbgF [Beijerinckiaceae bacterium]